MSSPQFQSSSASSAQPVVHENGDETSQVTIYIYLVAATTVDLTHFLNQLSTVTEIVSPQASQQLDTESPLFRSLLRLPAEQVRPILFQSHDVPFTDPNKKTQRRALADEIDVVVAHLQGLVEVVERYSDINATQINRIVGSFNPSIKFRDDQSVVRPSGTNIFECRVLLIICHFFSLPRKLNPSPTQTKQETVVSQLVSFSYQEVFNIFQPDAEPPGNDVQSELDGTSN